MDLQYLHTIRRNN
nr:unnamed protein product [Callosobruchus chinensis]